jgi:1-aminocyclopropane-1-carboxylate deaminase/D-cysteine desulfhydrase-like pyridoxal-dependent ACC family enzyme
MLELPALGIYPTPVERVDSLCSEGVELWIKRDDLTHPVYGGNKVRKLEHLLAHARAAGAKRVVTIGAAGSHHVLATTYFARQAGIDVEAVLVPQPRSAHASEVLRAGLGLGLRALPVRSWAGAALVLASRALGGSYLLTVGGSSTVGAGGYVQAARELATQVREGVLPEPDVCIVALGSGGTAAGLAAGFAAERMKTRVVGICVANPVWAVKLATRWLTLACARRAGPPADQPADGRVAAAPFGHAADGRVVFDARFLGAGYGCATAEGDEATRVARDATGLELEPTYTAKAFAAALGYVRVRSAPCILYWHTLSSAPMEPLLRHAPSEEALPAAVRELLLESRPRALSTTR